MEGKDGDGAPCINRRTALALMAGTAIGIGSATSVNAQNSGASTLASSIHTELRELAPGVFAYLQREPLGQSNVFISNCGVVGGNDSLLIVDTTAAPIHAKNFISAIRQRTQKRFGHVVITHPHLDHYAGVQFFERAEVLGQDRCREMMAREIAQLTPPTWAQRENWSDGTIPYRPRLPSATYADRFTFYDYGDREIRLIYVGPAHTVGDTIVLLPGQKILFAGDIAFFGVTPANGSGYVAGWIKACDAILAMDVDTIVPGHGPVGSKAQLIEMRDYLVLLQREAKKRFDAGLSAGRAAADIDLGKYATWTDSDRIAQNVARLYSEFNGTITPETDRQAARVAQADYNAAKAGR